MIRSQRQPRARTRCLRSPENRETHAIPKEMVDYTLWLVSVCHNSLIHLR